MNNHTVYDRLTVDTAHGARVAQKTFFFLCNYYDNYLKIITLFIRLINFPLQNEYKTLVKRFWLMIEKGLTESNVGQLTLYSSEEK